MCVSSTLNARPARNGASSCTDTPRKKIGLPLSRISVPCVSMVRKPIWSCTVSDSAAISKLYDVEIAAESDTVHDQIGFRTIETHGTEILLNGKPIFLRGVSVHEEAPFRAGRAF